MIGPRHLRQVLTGAAAAMALAAVGVLLAALSVRTAIDPPLQQARATLASEVALPQWTETTTAQDDPLSSYAPIWTADVRRLSGRSPEMVRSPRDAAPPPPPPAPPPSIQLLGIAIEGDRAYAILQDQGTVHVVSRGGSVRDVRVTAVHADRVVIDHLGRTLTLALRRSGQDASGGVR